MSTFTYRNKLTSRIVSKPLNQALIVRGYSEATQNTLNVSGRGILSKSDV